ncbi:hypothetical protein [Azospirillum isscasi]|uniref:Energy transducer TonB n=1 Tax=Azospirillum isscasi TaxID=3053926 RepID=A0ABU0WP23_9PROT|nr:hypothetical protein [Azospirillum isscasi]MDQ2105970.1 hypothetical protein [Azospirillum isscasi]
MAASSIAVQPVADTPVPERSRRTRSVFAWEAAKAAVAVSAFAGMLLPVAFPSKAGTQAKVVQLPVVEAPLPAPVPPPVKIQSQKAGVSAASSSPLKSSPVPQPAKKPVPKNT